MDAVDWGVDDDFDPWVVPPPSVQAATREKHQRESLDRAKTEQGMITLYSNDQSTSWMCPEP